MNKSLALKNKFYLFFLSLISFFIFVYLLYFLIYAERGIISYYKIKNINKNYTETFVNIESKNQHLIDKILRLQTNTIDLDFLDEKIREKTGYLSNSELIILFEE